jgi:hypothetical protein
MRPSYGFSRASKQILSWQGFQAGTRTHHQGAASLFRYFAISLFRYLAATILVKSVGVLWWWQRDLNQYSFI